MPDRATLFYSFISGAALSLCLTGIASILYGITRLIKG